MGGRPFFGAVLAILCGLAGCVGMVYFVAEQQWEFAAVCAGAVLTSVGLWKQWRWSWWVGFALASGILVWNYEHRATITKDIWFAAGALWIYLVIIFREYN